MNPATRLHALLTQFKRDPENKSLRKAISVTFGLENEKSPEVFRSYVKIITLAMEVEERVKAIPGANHALLLRSITSILKHLSHTNLDGDLHSFQQGLKPEDLHGLEFVFDRLDQIESEVEVTQERLAEFENTLSKLMDDIRDEKLDPQFTHFMLSNLFLLHLSVRNYRFFGTTGLRGSLAKIIGEFVLEHKDDSKSPKKESIYRRCVAVIKDINEVLVFIKNGVEVATALRGAEHLLLKSPPV